MEKDNYLFIVKKSRKIYSWVYLMVLIILGLLIYFFLQGYQIDMLVLQVSLGFIFLVILITEFNHASEWWAATDSALIQGKGIFDVNIGHIDFSKISDLELDQPFLKRFANFGTVNVRVFSKYMSIKNVNKPKELIATLQKLISKHMESKK